MGKMQDFITMVARMRDAQKAAEEKRTRDNVEEARTLETQVDTFILQNVAEQMNLLSWAERMQTDETPGAYNVTHGDEEKETEAT